MFFHSISGFNDALIFKDLTDADIAKIEKYMRECALDEIATALSESFDVNCDALVDEKQMIEIFGEKYAACPEKFEFLPGEIKLLKTLASHVKNLVDGNGENTGLAQFNSKKKKKKKNLMLNRIAKCRTQKPTTTKTSRLPTTKQLFERLLFCLNSFDITVDGWTEHLVEVDPSGSKGSSVFLYQFFFI